MGDCARNGLEVRILVLLLASALVASPVSNTLSFPPEYSAELQDVVARYLAATKVQNEAMKGAQIEMDIDGRFTKLREEGRMKVMRSISKLGDLTLHIIQDFTGDRRVEKELIARYLEAEQKEKTYGALSVSPQDYEFKVKAIFRQDGRSTYVFDVTPRKNDPGRFRGEIWVDGRTGMPLREAGRLVKSPHWLLTNLRFTRDYELKDGISVVKHFSSSTDVRLPGVGSAELDIDFSNFTRGSAAQASRL